MSKEKSKLYHGSICISDIVEAAKKRHSAFTKSPKNGKLYASILVWENAEKDEYGNTHSIQLNSTKEMKELEGKTYIGRAKPIERIDPQPIGDSDANNISNQIDDLPF